MAAAAKRKPEKQDQAHVITSGTTIRFEAPHSSRTSKSKAEHAVFVIQEANPVSGFVSFLREYAIVGLAVGFVIATQSQAIIKQLTTSFIDPMYALFFSGGKMSDNTFTVTLNGRSEVFAWGAFVSVVINFLFVMAVLYAIIKAFKLDKFDKKKEEAKK